MVYRQKPWVEKQEFNFVICENKTTLETSGEDVELHSKRVEKMGNYTRNEWRRCIFSVFVMFANLITMGIEANMRCYGRTNCKNQYLDWVKTPLETSVKDVKFHSKRV